MSDKIWNFSALNTDPIDQTTLVNQSNSFMFQLKENLKLNGWTAIKSSSYKLPTVMSLFSAVQLNDGRIFLIEGNNGTNTYLGTFNGNTINWVVSTPIPAASAINEVLLLPSGNIFINLTANTSGTLPADPSTSDYIGVVSGNTVTWTASTEPNTSAGGIDYLDSKTLLSDGRILRGRACGKVVGKSGPAYNMYSPELQFGTISGSNTISWITSTSLIPEYSPLETQPRLLGLPNNKVLYFFGYNMYVGTVSGTTVTWTAAQPVTISSNLSAAPILLDDGRIYITSVSADYLTTYAYYISIVNNVVSLVSAATPSIGFQYQCANIKLAGNKIAIMGGYRTFKHNLFTVYDVITGGGITPNYSSGDNLSSFSIMGGSTIFLKSPVGFIAGPDGSYSGSQSQPVILLQMINSAYLNIRLYESESIMANAAIQVIPSIEIPFASTLNQSKFNFAFTQKGGFWASIAGIATNQMSLLMTLLDLADVQKIGNNDHPYAIHMTYTNLSSNTVGYAYKYFDSVSNTNARGVSYDGNFCSPRALTWGVPTTTAYIPGTGTTNTGDYNGDILVSPIYIYDTTLNKVSMIGKIPDFKLTGASGLTNGSVVPSLAAPTHTVINGLLLPANQGLQL